MDRCDRMVKGVRCALMPHDEGACLAPPSIEYNLIRSQDWNRLEGYIEDDDSASYALLLRDLCEYNVPLWHHLVLKKNPTPHFYAMWDEIMKHMRVLVKVSRDHGKSDLFSVGWGSHDLAYSTFEESDLYDNRQLILRESTEVACTKVGAPIRGIFEENKLVVAMFGNLAERAATWTDNVIKFKSASGNADPHFECRGFLSGVTGGHPGKILWDDVVSLDNSESEVQRSRMWHRYTDKYQGMFSPKTRAVSLYTPYFVDDVNAELERTKRWYLIEMPALSRPPSMEDIEEVITETDDKGQETIVGVRPSLIGSEGLKPLWPCPLGPGKCVTYPHEAVADHEAEYGLHRSLEYLLLQYVENPVGFMRQYMLIMGSPGDTFIKAEQLRFWAEAGDPRVDQPHKINNTKIVPLPRVDEIIMGVHAWDHAISAKKKSAETAHAMLWRDSKNNVYSKTVSGRWAPNEVIPMMEHRFLTDPILSHVGRRPRAIVTEAINFQSLFGSILADTSKTILPIESVKHAPDKGVAFVESGLQAHIHRNKFFIHVDDVETANQFILFAGSKGGYKKDHVDANRLGFPYIAAAPKRGVVVHRSEGKRRRTGRWFER